MCACCGVAHEIMAALVLGFLQFICWLTVHQNCWSGGWVSDKAKVDLTYLEQTKKSVCEAGAGYEKMCKAYDVYPDVIKGAKAFCDAESGVLAIFAVSVIVALMLFFVAITNACKCCSCESCCGGKQRKNFLNVIFSAVGALIALIAWIIFLGLNSAYTKYREGLAKIDELTGNTGNTPISGTFYSFFQSALTICVGWMFFVILQRVVQGVLSFLASREEWKEGEMNNIQMA